MARFPHAELLELFIQEVESYLPEIRKGLLALASDPSASDILEELHRLFHNIKGAASQVQMMHLSKGAKIVESLLADLVEGGAEASAGLVVALNRVVDLIDEFVRKKNAGPVDEETLHAQIDLLFNEFLVGDEKGCLAAESEENLAQGGSEQDQYVQTIRSVLPLLQELATYLSPEASDSGANNAKIYGKLSQAVMTLAAAGSAAGYGRQSRLMSDFHLLLEKMRSSLFCRLPEMPGLIEDFLRFLEVVYTYGDPENSATVRRVQEQLHGLHTLLAMSGGQLPVAAEKVREPDFQDGFLVGSDLEDEPIMLLEEFTDSLLSEEQVEEAEFSAFTQEELHDEPFFTTEEGKEDETVSEEQQLLLDIFRSECEEHLIVINQSLNKLENEVKSSRQLSSDLRETISVMRRAVHTLKGAAAMTGMNMTARGAHSLEDMLDWIHDDALEISPEEIQILATGIDVVELLSQSAQSGESVHLNHLVKTIDDYLMPRNRTQQPEDTLPEEFDEARVSRESEHTQGEEGSDGDAESLPDQAISATLPGDSGIIRVKIDDLDELVGIEGELVVARGAMEKMLEEFSGTLFELDTVKENLRRKSQELEAGFEVQSLYGFSPRMGEETLGSDFSEFDPIELDRYSQLNLIIRSLNEISVDVNSIHATLASLVGDIEGQVGKQQLTMRLMQEKLMRIRMTPMSSLSRALFRTVRETAKKLAKKANLVIVGEDVFMDRFVWAKITDPLMHILRNALDHGIESPEKRAEIGKPESGTIRLEASQRSRFVVLRISDDGGGIDIAKVKEKVARGGFAANPGSLSEKELLEFLFHPSFTTRQDVTTISGRGIGLDVVRKNIQDLHGSVQLINMPGQGVVFEIRIPFTLSVNRAIMVKVAGRVFAVPLQDIQQVKRFSAAELEENGGVFIRQGAEAVPVVNLGFCLQLEPKKTSLPPGGLGMLAILFHKEEKLFAVSVDEVVEQREIVVKNLGSHLTHVPGISGVTFTGSGELIPIVNLREIMDVRRPMVRVELEPVIQAGVEDVLKVLIVDDSISVRHSVARLVEGQGWKQLQALDGIDALEKLETFMPDVIILDIEMPRMNGYEFKSNLNNNERLKDIPVVMLTSRASEKHQQKARDLGVQHYMTKPYQEESFIRLLENVRSGYSH